VALIHALESLCVLWITRSKMPECSLRRPGSGPDIHHERILMRPVASGVTAYFPEKEFYEVRGQACNSAPSQTISPGSAVAPVPYRPRSTPTQHLGQSRTPCGIYGASSG